MKSSAVVIILLTMAIDALKLPCFAKINLHLEVVGKRPDGFHELVTVFQTVSLADELAIERLAGEQIIFECDDATIPADKRNLVVKAANLLRSTFAVEHGARLSLKKRIPSPGGLGGGSSDAAVALLGLNKIWELGLSVKELELFAAELGSDVPFFLYGGTALGTGRGTEIEPLPDDAYSAAGYYLIVTPDVEISTAQVFADLNARNLTNADRETNLIVCRFPPRSAENGFTVFRNDLEPHVVSAYSEVEQVVKTLQSLNASQVMLSGSGASVFGLFEKEETRQAALKALDKKINWRKFAVAAISGEEYRRALSAVL